nr:hypothetical protein [uncultured Sphingorhabdus sp.]
MKRNFASLFMLTLLASGCGQAIETRVTSMGTPTAAPAAFMLSTTDETPAEVRRAYPIVTKRMIAKGFSIAKEAPLHLQVTVDARDAALALGNADGVSALSAAKARKPLQSCADKEYRVGVTLTRVADGAELFRGRAAEYHCKMKLADALPALVDAALADLGAPRGVYVITRKGID